MKALFLSFTFLAFVFSSTHLFAQTTPPSVEDEVIAITYAQWKANMEKNTAEANKILADDYTEFNGGFATRVDGKELNSRIAEAFDKGAGQVIAAEMLNPKVQVYGDVAILSYNYAGVNQSKDGKVENIKAKSTRVYVRMNGTWKLVHANFGLDPSNN
jgi:ketosteroid isomerase-like protein